MQAGLSITINEMHKRNSTTTSSDREAIVEQAKNPQPAKRMRLDPVKTGVEASAAKGKKTMGVEKKEDRGARVEGRRERKAEWMGAVVTGTTVTNKVKGLAKYAIRIITEHENTAPF